jgi:hypothetical protein
MIKVSYVIQNLIDINSFWDGNKFTHILNAEYYENEYEAISILRNIDTIVPLAIVKIYVNVNE